MKLTDKEKEIARIIGNYYLGQFNNDYQKCYDRLTEMGIKKVEYRQAEQSVFKNDDIISTVYVTLSRPGLLIGKYGKTIADITEQLSLTFKETIKIHIIEDELDDFLYPIDWSDDYDGFDAEVDDEYEAIE